MNFTRVFGRYPKDHCGLRKAITVHDNHVLSSRDHPVREHGTIKSPL